MEEGRESVAALGGYEGGGGASASGSLSGSGGREDKSASVSPSPTPSPPASHSPPPPPPVASAAAAPAGGVGMGLVMGAGMAPHHPFGLGGAGRVVGMGVVAPSMMAVGNVGFGEDLARKKRGRPRKYGLEGMHGGASLSLSSPGGASVVQFSSASAGELSSESPGAKRRRGRPRGSGRRQLLASLGEWFAYSAGGNFTPHIITIAAGEDVATRILSFSHKGPRSICILSANGSVSNVTLRQPGSAGGTLTFEGRFEIISLSGSFTITENGGIRSRTGGISVSLAGPDGRVVGGGVAGLLLAASPIQVVVGSFLPNILKPHKPRLSLPSPPFATIPTAPGVVTAARPLSQTNPDDGCKTPTSTLHGHSQGETQKTNMSNSTMPNYSSLQPVSWHGLQSSAEQKPSPDINVCLTGE